MNAGLFVAGLALSAAVAAGAVAAQGGDEVKTFTDPAEDAALRLTDSDHNGEINPTATLPDLLCVRLYGWDPDCSGSDPYQGTIERASDAHIFRMDVVFRGLVNPPGTIGSGGGLFDPFAFGPSPVFGFIELDVDRDADTGGELAGSATQRYLANVGRFGTFPRESLRSRTATSGLNHSYDGDFYSTPQYERSGQDFSLVLCGCHPITIESGDCNANGIFDTDETWVVRSRFFQRAGGYREASGVDGGTEPGLYNPVVNLRFAHSSQTDQTTISLVYGLDMEGAAYLAGHATQPLDQHFDEWGNDSSIREALQDIIWGAQGYNGDPLSGPVADLTERWAHREAEDFLNIMHWDVTALVGTGYLSETESLYAWTDVGFGEHPGDLNGDGEVTSADTALFDLAVQALDGGPCDGDGLANGIFVVQERGPNFSLYDFNDDGAVDEADRVRATPDCRADWNKDHFVNSQDLFDFLASFFILRADFNLDGFTNSQDFFDFLAAFFVGCG